MRYGHLSFRGLRKLA
jgi:hypothetical protein